MVGKGGNSLVIEKMAICRFLYRRKSFIALFLVVTTFWIIYMIISAPAATDNRIPGFVYYQDSDTRGDEKKQSVTRKVVVPPALPLQPQDIVIEAPNVNKEQPKKDTQDPGVKEDQNDNEKNVIPPPPDPDTPDPDTPDKQTDDKSQTDNKVANHVDRSKNENMNKSVEIIPKALNETKKVNGTKGPVLKEMGDKMIEFGEKFKNKTYDVGEQVVNKTLEKLTDLGVIKKTKYVKLVYNHVNWMLNLSVEDIGNIMKDTEFLKKKQNITEMEYQPLMPEQSNSTKNVIFNVTSSKYGLGFCDCKELSCLCCVRVVNKWMKLNSSTCSRITFSSKSQELDFEFSVNMKPIYSKKISAEFPPKVCLESEKKVAGMCILFSNVTSKVHIQSDVHKLHLSGCMEFDLTLYNKTVSAFPVGCFKIPSKESNSDEKSNNFINFVP